MTSTDWFLIAVLGVVYLATAIRAATAARRLGRRPWVWLAITLCCTAVPAMIVFYRDAMRRHRQRVEEVRRQAQTGAGGRMVRCPHCQNLLDPADFAGSPAPTCSRCHMSIQKDTFA